MCLEVMLHQRSTPLSSADHIQLLTPELGGTIDCARDPRGDMHFDELQEMMGTITRAATGARGSQE